MKNFRKTIIALATVAAMLVPSAAMAATLTTTVDKDITGDVYVGFYDGAILKDVVKTTVDDITVADATPAGEEETLPATLTITDAVAGKDSNGVEVRKLTFTAQASNSITSWNAMLSYDSTVVVPVPATESSWGVNITTDLIATAFANNFFPWTLTSWTETSIFGSTTKSFGNAKPVYTQIGDRVGMYITQQGGGTDEAPITNGLKLCDFYYKVLDGKTVDANTFKFETEIGTGTINDAIGSKGAELGFKLSSKTGTYTYGAWNNGTAIADTIKIVTPWDVQESTTKDLEVTVPTGAEAYTATMFIWDADQNAVCDPITTFTKN